ncbi:Membrane protein YcjF [Salmonella enterica subsp. enterica]|uniref:Membrane protein YcjF n=1 Tax=Salmonella enterica I TaxID=59201 RepID=A0A379VR41_SALET|nr:Membrane protein YcjF [Salmonella enterica subsp. enterica]
MSEPLKPRIDFAEPLKEEPTSAFKAQQTFSEAESRTFAPAAIDEPPEDEGVAEAAVDAALRPKRSLWRKMVMGGLALFGASVVGQGVQWTMNAWQTQDWVALGGCAAGALIIGAGVGSVVTEWRRLWRLRQRAHERDEARELLHSHSVGKGRAFCENWRSRRGLINHIRHYNVGMPLFTKRKTTGKSSVCMRIWYSRYLTRRRDVRLAVSPRNRL